VSIFFLGAAIFVVIALLFIFFPWMKHPRGLSKDTLSNTSLIKQRLGELETEQQQGLLTNSDRIQSENELKLALLDEVKPNEVESPTAYTAIITGATVSLVVGVGVYWYSNQLGQINHWYEAKGQTSEFGQRMLAGDQTLNLNDLETFALGLRTKLVEKPEDAVGWMLLGRVLGAINRVESAIQAFEKSLQYDPNNTTTLSSYAQALLMTRQEPQLLQAKKTLLQILRLEPNNTNAMGVLAVVASELGDKSLALYNWQSLLKFVPESDPNYATITQRIGQLKGELGQSAAPPSQASVVVSPQNAGLEGQTRVAITVNVSDELKAQLPAKGYLFVFAQESTGKVRMPAAVVKMPLADFPVVVELSDRNAMMANYTLSQLEQVKLVARISVDENVAQSSGEMQGEWLATLSDKNLTQETITIDKLL
jgi:cytochrome c-type biogenesis protein CcmI